jgi:hypothetical protein
MVGFSVNMVTIEEKGKTKVLTSAREKQGGSVDPTRPVTLEQVHGGGALASSRAISRLGNHPGPNPESPRAFSSTNGNASRKRSATRS